MVCKFPICASLHVLFFDMNISMVVLNDQKIKLESYTLQNMYFEIILKVENLHLVRFINDLLLSLAICFPFWRLCINVFMLSFSSIFLNLLEFSSLTSFSIIFCWKSMFPLSFANSI
jgi:hypothetical protein